MRVNVYGASDDCIEIDGAIREEFYARELDDNAEGALLAFSDGTVLRITYGDSGEGFWRIRRLATGTATYSLEEATDEDSDYSDKATLTGDNLRWVVCGRAIARTPAPSGAPHQET